MTTATMTIIGIDVSKACLDCWALPADRAWSVEYTDASLSDLVAELVPLEPQRVIVEATGGLETRLVTELAAAGLPELGHATPKAIAALAGVAPYNRDRGQWRGKRSVWGGRRQLRAALYLATLAATRCNPAIRACYERLRAAGKAQKVALIACMRKLLTLCNAIIKSNTPWQNPVAAAA